jgi:hypothetical protein
MTPGNAFTVSTRVAMQPVEFSLNVIMAVPAEAPEHMPVVEPMVAMEISLLLQVPAPASPSGVDCPTQMPAVPDIAGGAELTTKRVVVIHPVVGNV